MGLSLEVESLKQHVGGTSRLTPPSPAPGHTRAGGQKEEVLTLRAWVTWREQEGKDRVNFGCIYKAVFLREREREAEGKRL